MGRNDRKTVKAEGFLGRHESGPKLSAVLCFYLPAIPSLPLHSLTIITLMSSSLRDPHASDI